jgi:hypothetical protein
MRVYMTVREPSAGDQVEQFKDLLQKVNENQIVIWDKDKKQIVKIISGKDNIAIAKAEAFFEKLKHFGDYISGHYVSGSKVKKYISEQMTDDFDKEIEKGWKADKQKLDKIRDVYKKSAPTASEADPVEQRYRDYNSLMEDYSKSQDIQKPLTGKTTTANGVLDYIKTKIDEYKKISNHVNKFNFLDKKKEQITNALNLISDFRDITDIDLEKFKSIERTLITLLSFDEKILNSTKELIFSKVIEERLNELYDQTKKKVNLENINLLIKNFNELEKFSEKLGVEEPAPLLENVLESVKDGILEFISLPIKEFAKYTEDDVINAIRDFENICKKYDKEADSNQLKIGLFNKFQSMLRKVDENQFQTQPLADKLGEIENMLSIIEKVEKLQKKLDIPESASKSTINEHKEHVKNLIKNIDVKGVNFIDLEGVFNLYETRKNVDFIKGEIEGLKSASVEEFKKRFQEYVDRNKNHVNFIIGAVTHLGIIADYDSEYFKEQFIKLSSEAVTVNATPPQNIGDLWKKELSIQQAEERANLFSDWIKIGTVRMNMLKDRIDEVCKHPAVKPIVDSNISNLNEKIKDIEAKFNDILNEMKMNIAHLESAYNEITKPLHELVEQIQKQIDASMDENDVILEGHVNTDVENWDASEPLENLLTNDKVREAVKEELKIAEKNGIKKLAENTNSLLEYACLITGKEAQKNYLRTFKYIDRNKLDANNEKHKFIIEVKDKIKNHQPVDAGYLFSVPLSENEIQELLREGKDVENLGEILRDIELVQSIVTTKMPDIGNSDSVSLYKSELDKKIAGLKAQSSSPFTQTLLSFIQGDENKQAEVQRYFNDCTDDKKKEFEGLYSEAMILAKVVDALNENQEFRDLVRCKRLLSFDKAFDLFDKIRKAETLANDCNDKKVRLQTMQALVTDSLIPALHKLATA